MLFGITVQNVIALIRRCNALLAAGLCTDDSVTCVKCSRVYDPDL